MTNLPSVEELQAEVLKLKAEIEELKAQAKIPSEEEIAKAIYEHLNTHGYNMMPFYARESLAHAIHALLTGKKGE